MEKVKNDPKAYVGSVICNGYLVNIFLDDYGQQYFYQYLDKDGNLQETGCGSYNFDYLSAIEYELDYDAWLKKQPEAYQKILIEGRKKRDETINEKQDKQSNK